MLTVRGWKYFAEGTSFWIEETKVLMPHLVGHMRNQAAFTCGKLGLLYSENETHPWGWLKHFSISHPGRYPTWDEILAAKEVFFGDIDAMMVMPKRENYVHIHDNCFHVWQTPERWDIA